MVWFEAKDLDGFDHGDTPGQPHDESFNRVTYVWTVERPSGDEARYTAPNIPDSWNRPSRAYGKKVAFFFTEEATRYVIRLWAIDESGHIGEADTTVTTLRSSDVYPGEQTICLDPSGRFNAKPDGAFEATTMADMQTAISRIKLPTRLLIARGANYPDFYVDARGHGLDHIGAFGDPLDPRPVLVSVGYASNMMEFEKTNHPQATFHGLDMRGGWDASTETGHQSSPPMDIHSPDMRHFTIWDCRFDGIGTVKASVDAETDWIGGFGNTEITNWSGFGMWVPEAPKARLAFVGCDIAQHPDALNHYHGGPNGLRNTQGPVRISDCGSVYFGASSFLSRGGWSGANDQECLRLNSAGTPGSSYVVERCTLEGGSINIKMSGSNPRRVENPGNYLLDKVLLLSSGGKTGFFGAPHFGGTTVRNTLMVQLDVPNADSYGCPHIFSLKPDQNEPANLSAPVAIYNCSVMNLRTAGNDDGDKVRFHAGTPFFDLVEENNIKHAPSLGRHPEDDHAPISVEARLAGFTPRYRGTRQNFPFQEGELQREIAPGGGLRVLYPDDTDQSYWQALPDSDWQHGFRLHPRTYFAESGTLEIRFEPDAVHVVNASEEVWKQGAAWTLRLDRKSKLPAMDTRFGNPTDEELPIPLPDVGSPARLAGKPLGRHAYDDFLGNVRPGPSETGQDHDGNARPTEGGTRGAFHV